MIRTRTPDSARAETFGRRTRKIVAGAFALATMLLPFGAWGMDGSPKLTMRTVGNLLPLPPIPYLDSMLWMNWKPSAPIFKVDTLLLPIPAVSCRPRANRPDDPHPASAARAAAGCGGGKRRPGIRNPLPSVSGPACRNRRCRCGTSVSEPGAFAGDILTCDAYRRARIWRLELNSTTG
jgi:hypothetical protein